MTEQERKEFDQLVQANGMFDRPANSFNMSDLASVYGAARRTQDAKVRELAEAASHVLNAGAVRRAVGTATGPREWVEVPLREMRELREAALAQLKEQDDDARKNVD